ncbi:cation-translocating P-type ATPase [Pontibacter cellulosilyticus]|uniref:Cation-translocating P-type ATPase n=1 Tax=Pontibacter cellulosilyticus TaxID=1720253 RepID=A0A923SHX7_9BACT|nr:cation-translocating P-type ATPase [Pontibacter cellulosilyticus]MBC5992214.1 cation-translocating P-type ATPase [Pontibacter cellulosilyticus]
MSTWHTIHKENVLNELKTTPEGLLDGEAEARLKEHGPNRLEEKRRKSPLKMLLQQFTETMVVILIVAALLSLFLGKTTEAVAILIIVLLFGFLGFIQEYRADRAMAALNRMVVPKVRVRRAGKVKEIAATELVPGDIVELEAGNVVPADLRVLDAFNLKIQEAALTGESEPIDKSDELITKEDAPLGDRRDMAYMGTVVTYGRGVGITVATGMRTELGKIADMIGSVETGKTPLQEKLDKLGKMLALFGAAAAALIFAVGVLSGETAADMFLTAVSVAVAVVPEGLPAVVTITLALGSQRMLRRNALIRKLPAVETLGSVTMICSDKTGTLTENKMTVTVMELPEQTVEIPPAARLETDATTAGNLDFALAISVLCNDATHERGVDSETEQVIGDPTETSLLIAGAKRGITKEELYEALPRVNEVPFDSNRKRMSTIHKLNGDLPDYFHAFQDDSFLLCCKGAPDSLLSVSNFVWVNGEQVPLDTGWRDKILDANSNLAKNGMRVLGLAFRKLSAPGSDTDVEQELVFVGLAGIIDPPRQEVKVAVEQCRLAGIRPVMITGDHPLTAAAIGRELHFSDQSEAITGERLQKADEQELADLATKTSVYARVSPEDKLRIVNALQQKGEVVAMTGDGVNDAPALRKADIGVAMGITGTDVAKEAADMVLLDDNFATIVAAVEEGRVIFDNLLRFIKFSLAGNLGKVIVMLIAPLFGMVVALQPLQLLWLNLLTDGLLGLGLGTEPAEKDTMSRPPRNPAEGALRKQDFPQLAIVGVTIAAVSIGLAVYYYNPSDPEDLTWQTMIFATIGFSQVFQALALRSSGHSAFAISTNPLMAIVAVSAIALQLLVIYLPGLEGFFRLVPLSAEDLLISIAAGSLVFVVVKLEKRFLSR